MALLFTILVLISLDLAVAQILCGERKSKLTDHIFHTEENVPLNSKIGHLDIIGNITQVTLEPKDNKYLYINQTNRNIYTKSEIDYETVTEIVWPITCKVEDAAVNIRVRVFIGNKNDNPPKFAHPSYSVNVSEMISLNSEIITVEARDKDLHHQTTSHAIFSIIPGPFSDYFKFSNPKDGTIVLNRTLDYETKRQIHLLLKAQDILNSTLTSFANLTINVEDEDDLNPSFTHPVYSATISPYYHPGTVINFGNRLHAYDQDVSINSPIIYSLFWDSQNALEIDSKTGNVSLKRYITSDVIGVIKATQIDNSDKAGTAVVQIYVRDPSSNFTFSPTSSAQTTVSTTPMPIFPEEKITLSVREDFPVGHVILLLGQNIQKTISWKFKLITNTNKRFFIHPSGAIILRRSLDYESNTQHEFGVSVTDIYGRKMNSAVTILVTNVNEFAPQILKDNTQVTLKRDPNVLVTTIEAVDGDSDTTLRYKLASPDRFFSVNDLGEVYTTSNISHLNADLYNLVVIVSDNGDKPLFSVATVNIHLDYDPEVEYVSIMSENARNVIIILGAIGGFLVILVIILIIYVVRRRIYRDEHLSRVSIFGGIGAAGLRYKDYRPQNNFANTFIFSKEDGSSDGATTLEENVNRDIHSDNLSDTKDSLQQLDVDTGMTILKKENSLKKHYQNGGVTTFKDSIRTQQSSNDSVNSGDINNIVTIYNNSLTPWPRPNHQSSYKSVEKLESAIVPADDKPEITVYF